MATLLQHTRPKSPLPNYNHHYHEHASSHLSKIDLLDFDKHHYDHPLRSYLSARLGRAFRLSYPVIATLTPTWIKRGSKTSSNSSNSSKTRALRSTAYLDGIRGVASLFVFIHHYPLDYFVYLHDGFLAKPTDKWLLQLPFVRIVYSGRFMVGLFFVLSGYVLAYRPLQLIRAGNEAAILDCLASSVFRRAIRLFMPVLLSTYIVMILVHNGWYGSLNPVIKVPAIAPLSEQTTQWLLCLAKLLNPFTWDSPGPIFSNQLWTLPVEFRGSILVFLCLLGLCKAKTAVRMTVISSFALYCFYSALHWDMSLFLTGIVLAELRQVQNTWTFTVDDLNIKSPGFAKAAIRGCWMIVFLLSWFLACWPDFLSDHSPGYIFFSSITPSQFPGGGGRTHFWTSIAAVLMLLALENNPILQRPFTTPVAQYLGDISFALYIVHIPICYSIGRMITVGAMDLTGLHFTGFMLAAAIVVPMVLWVADVYWRLVDTRSVAFAKWLWIKSCKDSK